MTMMHTLIPSSSSSSFSQSQCKFIFPASIAPRRTSSSLPFSSRTLKSCSVSTAPSFGLFSTLSVYCFCVYICDVKRKVVSLLGGNWKLVVVVLLLFFFVCLFFHIYVMLQDGFYTCLFSVNDVKKLEEASKKNGNLVPLCQCIFSDQLTPILAYRCLVKEDDREAPSFLFESVEPSFRVSTVVYKFLHSSNFFSVTFFFLTFYVYGFILFCDL